MTFKYLFKLGIILMISASCHRDYKNPFDTKVTLSNIYNFQARADGETILLSWITDDQIKTGYIIEKRSPLSPSSDIIIIDDPSQAVYVDTAVITDNPYTYIIQGISDENKSAVSQSVSVTARFPSPYNVRIESISDTSAQISWSDTCRYEHGFTIERKEANAAEWKIIGHSDNDTTQIEDKTLTTNNTYYYRITGYTDRNQSSPSEYGIITTVFPAPSDFSISTSSEDAVQLSWIDNCSFELGYSVKMVIQGQTDTTLIHLAADANQITIDNLDPESGYEFVIIAYTKKHHSDPIIKEISFIEDFQWQQTLSMQKQTISTLCFFDNDHYLASGSHDNTVRIWSTDDWHLVNTAAGDAQDEENQVTALAFISPNNLAIGNQIGSLKIWNVFAWNQTSYLYPNSYPLHDIFISNETNTIFAAKYKYIYHWSVVDWEYQGSLSEHTGNILTLAHSPLNQLFVSGGEDDLIHVWSLNQRSQQQTVTGHTADITTLCFSTDERLLASGSQDQTVKVWSVETWQQVQSLNTQDTPKELVFSQNGHWLICASERMTGWLTSTWQASTLLTDMNTSGVYSLAFSQNGKWLAAGNDQGEILIINAAGQWQIMQAL